jgi:hypothetical protein
MVKKAAPSDQKSDRDIVARGRSEMEQKKKKIETKWKKETEKRFWYEAITRNQIKKSKQNKKKEREREVERQAQKRHRWHRF